MDLCAHPVIFWKESKRHWHTVSTIPDLWTNQLTNLSNCFTHWGFGFHESEVSHYNCLELGECEVHIVGVIFDYLMIPRQCCKQKTSSKISNIHITALLHPNLWHSQCYLTFLYTNHKGAISNYINNISVYWSELYAQNQHNMHNQKTGYTRHLCCYI